MKAILLTLVLAGSCFAQNGYGVYDPGYGYQRPVVIYNIRYPQPRFSQPLLYGYGYGPTPYGYSSAFAPSPIFYNNYGW